MRKAILCLILSFMVFPSLAQSEQPAPVPITPENIHSLSLLGHVGRGTLGDIGWSADGQWLFVETTLGIEKYDYEELSAPPEYVNVPDDFDLLATHPVENWLVGLLDGAIHFWDFATENTVHTIDLSERNIQPEKVFFDADGTLMAIVHDDGNEYHNRWVYIWNVSDLNQPHIVFDRYSRFDTNVALLEDIAVILSRQSLIVSTFDGNENESLLLSASKFAISPDASEIFMIGGEVYNIAEFLSGDNNRPAYSVPIAAQDVGFSTNGNYLVTLDLDRTFNVYDSQTFERVRRFENISPASFTTDIRHFFPHPHDNFLILKGSSNLYTYQFDATAPQLLATDYNITPHLINADGTHVIAIDGYRASIWTTNPVEKLFSIENIYGTPPLLTFNENDDMLIYNGGFVSIWDLDTQAQSRFREIDSYPSWGGVSNGRWFAVGNLLIDATTLAVNQPFMQALTEQGMTEGRITGFDPQSRAVLYLTNDTLYILNLADGAILETFADGDATYRLFCEDIIESMQYSAIQLTESAGFLAPYQWLVRVFRTNPYDWSCTGRERDFSAFEAMQPLPTANSETVYFLFNRGELWSISE